ncbi:helix-turn-helix transcriptional regulator [Paenibacillus baekrokdamisoli]|nr:helix-turn-helix transcriptional regulator [Paenibacillus baekrokdamisoli]
MIFRKKPINESDKSSVVRVDKDLADAAATLSGDFQSGPFYWQLNKADVTIQPTLDRITFAEMLCCFRQCALYILFYRRYTMLDLRKIGAYISKLRKDQDLTQLELANQLNVSHQAVSKWERGESLPDIGTLPQFAKLFGKTVDDIINAGENSENREHQHLGTIVREIAENRLEQVAEMVNTGEVELEELVEVAPFVKASALHKVTERLDSSVLKLDVIMRLAPFLGTDKLDELVRQAEEGEIVWNSIAGLAPFVSSDTLSRLVDKSIDGSLEVDNLVGIAPFLGREHVDQLVQQVEQGRLSWHSVQGLAPFISRATLSRLVDRVVDGTIDANRIISLAPFLDRENLEKLIGGVEAEHLTPDLLASLAPFVDQGTLSSMVTNLLNKVK